MSSWPNTLPDYPTYSGYARQVQGNKLTFTPDAGTPKERNRTTTMPDKVSERYVLTVEQYNALENFWRNTCRNGVLPFSKPNPETKNTDLYKFDGDLPAPAIAGQWRVLTITLERLP